jgi:hypothetical protein
VGQCGRAPDGDEHAAHVGAQRAARGVHREDRLQRAHVPRQPQVADPPLAANHHVPLVEAEIRVAAARGEDGLDALDLAEYRAQQVEPVHAEVAEGVASLAVVRGQRATRPGRVGRAAEVLGADRLADPTRRDRGEHVSHVGVGEQRVVHAHAACSPRRRGGEPRAVGVAGRERLLDQHVAAALERLQRDLRVRVGRREHVDHVDAGRDHGLEVRKDADTAGVGCEALRPRRIPIGDTYRHGARDLRHRVEVYPGDRARADEADPERFRRLPHAAGASGADIR